jgi:hypothetical protein
MYISVYIYICIYIERERVRERERERERDKYIYIIYLPASFHTRNMVSLTHPRSHSLCQGPKKCLARSLSLSLAVCLCLCLISLSHTHTCTSKFVRQYAPPRLLLTLQCLYYCQGAKFVRLYAPAFSHYLTQRVGTKFDPHINFTIRYEVRLSRRCVQHRTALLRLS